MVLDSVVSSPHRRSPSFRRRNELGSWSTLVQRHRFLLAALVLLTFLCTVYLYFAVTFEAISSCSGLTGAQKASCQLKHARSFMRKAAWSVTMSITSTSCANFKSGALQFFSNSLSQLCIL